MTTFCCHPIISPEGDIMGIYPNMGILNIYTLKIVVFLTLYLLLILARYAAPIQRIFVEGYNLSIIGVLELHHTEPIHSFPGRRLPDIF